MRWSHRAAAFRRTQPMAKGMRPPQYSSGPTNHLPSANHHAFPPLRSTALSTNLYISPWDPTCSFLPAYTSQPYPTKSSRPQVPWNMRQPFLRTKSTRNHLCLVLGEKWISNLYYAGIGMVGVLCDVWNGQRIKDRYFWSSGLRLNLGKKIIPFFRIHGNIKYSTINFFYIFY